MKITVYLAVIIVSKKNVVIWARSIGFNGGKRNLVQNKNGFDKYS